MPQEGLLRNNYVRRTFILPDGRGDAVAEKFTPVPGIVRGKKVVLVDDSVVRGNTMTRLVQMMRKAGAAEVHIRSASPQIKHGCFYGVDFSGSESELVAVGRTVADIAAFVGADSIGYVDQKEMIDIASRLSGRKNGFCTACFDGDYPVPVDPQLLLSKAC
jgi:amidophosphoribosyltransferase